jgi:hypothetical protein
MDTSKCIEVIEKIGENHLVIKKVLYDKSGNEVVIETEEFGQSKIDQMKVLAQAEVDKWTKLKDVKLIDAEIEKAQAKLSRANLLQSEIAKPIMG